MRRLATAALVVLAASLPSEAGSPPPARGPLSVFVQARADEPEPSPSVKKELEAKSEATWKALEDLRARLQKQHGKDRAKWPAEQRAAYYEAADHHGVAWSEAYYYARPAKEKTDSIKDFQKYLSKGKYTYLSLAASAEEADLVLEVMGRKGTAKFIRGTKYLGFDVLPGKLPGEALVALPRDVHQSPYEDHLLVLHWPKAGEPYLRLESNDVERWQDVAEYGVIVLDEWVRLYYDTLRPAP